MARAELAAEFLEDMRRLDAQLRGARKKLAAAVKASGTTLTQVFGVGPVIAGTIIGDIADVSRFPGRDHFAAYNGTAPVEVSSGNRKIHRLSLRGKPPRRPRDPHGRDHPDPAPAQRRPRLLREEAGRGQDAQRSAPVPQTADQRRHLRPPPGRRPARRTAASAKGPGGQPGNDSDSSAAGSHPERRLFGQATPGPGHHDTARHQGSHTLTVEADFKETVTFT